MFDVHRIHDVSVVDLTGELSRRNIQVLDEVLSSLSRCEQRNVVLDLAGLEHLDYKLVGRIAERVVEFKCDGGDLKMAAANGYIQGIMRAFGFEEEVYVSVEDALLSFVCWDPGGNLQ